MTLHYVRGDCPERKSLNIGEKNVQRLALVKKQNKKQILLPSLHITLRVMENFVKSMDRAGSAFKYFPVKFPRLSEANIKEGIFIGPQVRQLFRDEMFDNLLQGD